MLHPTSYHLSPNMTKFQCFDIQVWQRLFSCMSKKRDVFLHHPIENLEGP